MFSGRSHGQFSAVVLGGRAEVPDVRIAAAGQERVAGHLVARPLADVGARDVADVVEVEEQDGARRPTPRGRRGRAPSRYVRRRSTFQRSSQSTFIEPGEANEVGHRASPVLVGRVTTGGTQTSFTRCYTSRAVQVRGSSCAGTGDSEPDATSAASRVRRPMWLDIVHDSARFRQAHRAPLASVEMHSVGQVDWSFADQPAPASATSIGPRRASGSSVRTRAPSTPSSRSARSPPAAGSRRHVHSFEEALYVLAGELPARHRRARPSPPAGRLRAACRSGPGTRSPTPAPSRSAGSRSTRRSGSIRPRGRRDTFFRDGPLDVAGPGGTRPPGRRSAIPTLRLGRPLRRARRRRPRRSGSATRPAVARRPGWTRRSWPTAGSR